MHPGKLSAGSITKEDVKIVQKLGSSVDSFTDSEFENEPLFSWTLKSKKLLQYLSHQMFVARVWSIKCRRKEKLIAQFGGKLRDERFKPN